MLQINVDGFVHRAVSGPENWGDLLNWLENGDGPERRVVTAVRFGGVAEPTFREPSALARGLGELGPIDVVTSSADDLLRESAQAAYDGVQPLGRAVRRMAMKLRVGHEVAARRDLPALTSAVQTLTTLTAALSGASLCVGPHKTDFDALVLRLCRIVDAIISARVESDWNGVSIVLEHELAPTLDAWASVTRRIWKIV